MVAHATISTIGIWSRSEMDRAAKYLHPASTAWSCVEGCSTLGDASALSDADPSTSVSLQPAWVLRSELKVGTMISGLRVLRSNAEAEGDWAVSLRDDSDTAIVLKNVANGRNGLELLHVGSLDTTQPTSIQVNGERQRQGHFSISFSPVRATSVHLSGTTSWTAAEVEILVESSSRRTALAAGDPGRGWSVWLDSWHHWNVQVGELVLRSASRARIGTWQLVVASISNDGIMEVRRGSCFGENSSDQTACSSLLMGNQMVVDLASSIQPAVTSPSTLVEQRPLESGAVIWLW